MSPSSTEKPVASTPKTPEARSPSAKRLPSGAPRRTSNIAATARAVAAAMTIAGTDEVHREARAAACVPPWSCWRQPDSTPWTSAAPTIGSSGIGSPTG